MFERKMMQSLVEPAENKSFSIVYVNCTVCESSVWHNCLNERANFARRRQTLTYPLCMELLQALFSLTASSSLLKSSSSNWED